MYRREQPADLYSGILQPLDRHIERRHPSGGWRTTMTTTIFGFAAAALVAIIYFADPAGADRTSLRGRPETSKMEVPTGTLDASDNKGRRLGGVSVVGRLPGYSAANDD